jgi:hypothetical protein
MKIRISPNGHPISKQGRAKGSLIKKLLKKIPILGKISIALHRVALDFFSSPLPLRIYIYKLYLFHSRNCPISKKIEWDAIERPAIGYCMMNAALQAKALGLKKISAIEFGVAGGDGLLVIEKIAHQIKEELDIEFTVFGFDLSTGLPQSNDYRDQVYFWGGGDFRMDVDKLQMRLKSSKLILGDINETVSDFFDKYNPPPLGFISFDLDYYSSTIKSLKILNFEEHRYLPRIECYLDDVSSYNLLSASNDTGVLAAVNEFNLSSDVKLLKKIDVGRLRKLHGNWFETIFVAHFFEHSLYNKSLGVYNALPLRDE